MYLTMYLKMAYIPEFDKANRPKKVSQSERRRGKSPYNNRKWRNYSFKLRTEKIYCEDCLEENRFVLSKVTDHVVRVEDGGSFEDPRNHRALCDDCHNRKRGKEAHGLKIPSTRNENGELIPLQNA